MPSNDCNNGFGVGAGTQIRGGQLTPDPEVGHLTVDHTTVTGYQRAAIFVINDGSTGQIDHNTVKGTPCSVCAGPGGIGVFFGGAATIDHNTISGNECNDPDYRCGSDWFNDFESNGVLMIGAASSTVVSHNSLYTNDVGIYTDTGVTIDHNDVASRDVGIATDIGDAAQVDHKLDDRRHLRDPRVRRNRHLQPQLGERQLGRRSLVGRHRHAQLQPQQLRYGIAQQSGLGLPLAAVAHQRDHRARPAGAPGRGLQRRRTGGTCGHRRSTFELEPGGHKWTPT